MRTSTQVRAARDPMRSVSGGGPEATYRGKLPWHEDPVRPQEVVGVLDSVRKEVRMQGRERERGSVDFGDIMLMSHEIV